MENAESSFSLEEEEEEEKFQEHSSPRISKKKEDIIQGRNIRFKCDLFDFCQEDEQCQEALCYQVEDATLRECRRGVRKVIFAQRNLEVEGLLKLDKSIHKKGLGKNEFFFILDSFEKAARGVIQFKPTEWPRSKTPFKNFLRCYKPNFQRIWRKIGKKWFPKPIISKDQEDSAILDQILSSQELCSDEFLLKEFLLDHYDKSKLLNHGSSIVKNINLFLTKKAPEFFSKEKGCFPIWSEKRLQEIERIFLLQCVTYNSECPICREYQALLILKWWHSNIFFLNNNEPQMMFVKSDLSVVERKAHRLKGLIIRSDREAGKTSWFQAICQGDLERIVHFKNKFNAGEAEKLKLGAEKIWLILVDDFSTFDPTDLQALKALLVGEATTVLGKWLSYNYKGGVPCVVLCNSKQQFKFLFNDPEIQSQCKFIDLPPSVYLGPPETFQRRQTTAFFHLQNAT